MTTFLRIPNLLVAGLGLVLAAVLVPRASAETISNGVYEVHVQSTAEGTSAGSWNAVTDLGHEAGDGLDITFTAVNPTSNFSSLRIFGTGGNADYAPSGRGGATDLDSAVDSESQSPLAPAGEGWRTVWQLDAESLRIVQDVIVVGDDTQDSAVYHTVEIENFGTEPVRVGWRNLHDWSLTTLAGNEDGPANALESVCGTTILGPTRDEFSHRPVAAGWVRVDLPNQSSAYTPLLSLGFDPGLEPSLPVTVPDEYAFVNWGRTSGTAFDDSIVGDTDLPDSAGVSWFGRSAALAREIAPGATVRFTQALFAFEEAGCPPIPTCAEVPYGLVGWWPFNEEDQGQQSGEFEDLARDNRGIARFPPSAIDGKVGRAASFDGLLDEIVVVDNQDVEIAAGVDFSIDFWIRTADTSGLSVILEKRSVTPLRGYAVFLFNGRVGVQLADGGGAQGFLNFVAATSIADGDWHLVAVTVRRNDPDGLIWYVDGQEDVRFNPTGHAGSLENDAQLLIGAGDPTAPAAGAPFTGDLDELEIARRVLSPAEILAIYEADYLGKCSASIDVTWDIPKCLNSHSVEDEIRICNHGGREARYVFDFAPLPAGSPPSSLCNVNGPNTFDLLGSQPLRVPSGECRTARYRIRNVGNLPPNQGACFEATATDVVSGQLLMDAGSVRPNSQICCDRGAPVTPIRPGNATPTMLQFQLEDTGFGQSSLDVRISPPLSDNPDAPAVQLDDAPAGEAIDRTVTFGSNGTATLEVPVRLTEDAASLAFYDVLLSSLGQGTDPVPLVSASVVADPDPCVQGLNGLCLAQDRFRVEARWRTGAGDDGVSQAVPLTSDTGFFWFFSDTNLEIVVKVLDACSFNDRFWIFAGGLTDVEVELSVIDLLTGESKTYLNPLGSAFQPVQDTDAFATCDAGDAGSSGGFDLSEVQLPAFPSTGGAPSAGKVAQLPLNDDRFLVEAEWQTTSGETGQGEGVLLTSDTGYFWFFSDTNVELAVKILDACGFNDHYWVFAAGLTDVRVELTVTDTETGASQTYVNPLGEPFQPIQDTDAFGACP